MQLSLEVYTVTTDAEAAEAGQSSKVLLRGVLDGVLYYGACIFSALR